MARKGAVGRSGRRCRWFAGALDSVGYYKIACLTYSPTEKRHPKRWRYAIGPYSTRARLKKALYIPGAIVIIEK